MDYVLFLLDLAAGAKQHLRPLIVQKAKCIMYQKISLECPAGSSSALGSDSLSDGLGWGYGWEQWTLGCLWKVWGSQPLPGATPGPPTREATRQTAAVSATTRPLLSLSLSHSHSTLRIRKSSTPTHAHQIAHAHGRAATHTVT